jgi:hypothetical protein
MPGWSVGLWEEDEDVSVVIEESHCQHDEVKYLQGRI